MIGRRKTQIVLAALSVVAAGALRAQDSSCTWDRCALRVQSSLFSMKVVRGRAAEPVAKLGGFAPRIQPLADSRDTAIQRYYVQFRAAATRATALSLGGFALGVGALVAYEAPNHGGRGVYGWLLGASALTSIIQFAEQRRANDRLESAIWWYNRGLPR